MSFRSSREKYFGAALLTDADQIAFEPGSLKGLNSISNTLSFNQGCQLTVSTISLERVCSRLIKAKIGLGVPVSTAYISLNGFLALMPPSACSIVCFSGQAVLKSCAVVNFAPRSLRML